MTRGEIANESAGMSGAFSLLSCPSCPSMFEILHYPAAILNDRGRSVYGPVSQDRGRSSAIKNPDLSRESMCKVSAGVFAARCASLVNHNRLEQRQGGFEPIENPLGQDFARRIGKAFDFVQIIMIELPDDRLRRGLDGAVVDQITLVRVDIALD